MIDLVAGRYDNIDTWVDWVIIVAIFVVGMSIWIWWDRHRSKR